MKTQALSFRALPFFPSSSSLFGLSSLFLDPLLFFRATVQQGQTKYGQNTYPT
jgi:hypothetical protein